MQILYFYLFSLLIKSKGNENLIEVVVQGISEKDQTEILELVIQNDLGNPLTLDPVSPPPSTKNHSNILKTIVETRILSTKPLQTSTSSSFTRPASISGSTVSNNIIYPHNTISESINFANIDRNNISSQSTKNEIERFPMIIPRVNEIDLHKKKLRTRKCYVANTSFSTTEEVNNFIELLQTKDAVFKKFYTKNILGFSFCLDIPEGIGFINGKNEKFSMISIEDDTVFTIGSIVSTHKWTDKLHKNGMALFTTLQTAFSEKAISFMQNLRKANKTQKTNNKTGETINNKTSDKQSDESTDSSVVPKHFFKMMNIGNLVFNNYLLDNPIAKLLGINYLFRWFYNWEGGNAGKGVTIVALGTPKCTKNRQVTESLLSDKLYSLSGDATVRFIDAIDCGGIIKLSSLLKSLEDIGKADILLIPVSGPHSDLLNAAIKRLGRKVTIISAAGDDGIDACNTSPSGKEIIKVGSVTKYGGLSSFSNTGSCVNFYALGEEVMEENGSSYAAAIIASALAAFKEEFPNAANWQLQSFMRVNSAKNQEGQLIFKLPYNVEATEQPAFYATYLVFIFNTIVFCVIGALIYAVYRVIMRRRMKMADEKYLDKETPPTNSNPSLRQKGVGNRDLKS